MAEIIKIRCRGCEVKFKAPLKYQGRKVKCPQCGKEIKIPVLKQEPAAVVPAAAPMIVDEAPAQPKPRPRPEQKPEPVEVPMELGDDAFDEDPWDVGASEFDDYEEFEAAPRPKKKRSTSSGGRRPSKKKSKQKNKNNDWVDQGSIWGGLAIMIGAAAWLIIGLMNNIFFFKPAALIIVGAICFVKGIVGD